jgi:transcriptional/translational regulatory protein YebC/TACO1
MKRDGDECVVSTDLASFAAVQDGLRKHGIQFEQAELAMVPKATVDVAGEEAQRLIRLLDAIDEMDDVQKVYSNANMDDSVFAQSGA